MENSFLNNLLSKDADVLIYLNSLGSEHWDKFWLFITNQYSWTPVFMLLLVLISLKFGLKRTVFTLLFLVVLIAFSDQLTNLVKNTTLRIRPCNTEGLKQYLRPFSYKPGGYSFWSGHAFSSTSLTTFMILLLRPHYKFIYLLILFPVLFGLSRIYLGVHYPIDVTTGYIMGALTGVILYKAYRLLHQRIFKEDLL